MKNFLRTDSNTDSRTSNNTYLNIIYQSIYLVICLTRILNMPYGASLQLTQHTFRSRLFVFITRSTQMFTPIFQDRNFLFSPSLFSNCMQNDVTSVGHRLNSFHKKKCILLTTSSGWEPLTWQQIKFL